MFKAITTTLLALIAGASLAQMNGQEDTVTLTVCDPVYECSTITLPLKENAKQTFTVSPDVLTQAQIEALMGDESTGEYRWSNLDVLAYRRSQARNIISVHLSVNRATMPLAPTAVNAGKPSIQTPPAPTRMASSFTVKLDETGNGQYPAHSDSPVVLFSV